MASSKHITFAFQIDVRANRFGEYAILLRITQDGKRKYHKSVVTVRNKTWFNKNARNENWIRQSDPEYAKKNETLAKELAEAKAVYSDILEEQGVVTPYILKAKVEEAPVASSFLEFAREYCEDLHSNGQIRYWKQFRDLTHKLETFRKSRRMPDILFVDLTVSFLDKFEKFLQRLPNQRENGTGKVLSKNTVLNHLKRFRTLTRKAVKLGYLSVDKDPFLNYEFHWIPTTKDRLETDEIERIIKLDLEEGSMLWHTRNCFLFSFYSAGIRVGDLLQLRWRNVETGRIIYRMGKNHKPKDLKLVPQNRAILEYYDRDDKKRDDYIFPFMDGASPYARAVTQEEKDTMSVDLKAALFNDISAKTALLNKYLKEIAALAGIEKHLSFHVSRHSFAKKAKNTKDVGNGVIQGLLGHSSLKTTEGYMGEFDSSVEDDAMDKIFGTEDKSNLESFVENLTSEQRAALAKLLEKNN